MTKRHIIKISLGFMLISLGVISTLLLLSAKKDNNLDLQVSNNKVNLVSELISTQQINIDTLFTLEYFFTFGVGTINDNLNIGISGAENNIYYFNDSLHWKYKINEKFYIEKIKISSNYLLVGYGTENETGNISVYNQDFKYLYNLLNFEVNSITDDGIALCWGDYSNNKTIPLIDQMNSYHYLFSLKTKDTLYQFKDNYLVVDSYNGFCEIDINNRIRNGGRLEVINYDGLGERKKEFLITLSKEHIPIYFLQNKYLSKKTGFIEVYDFEGNLLQKFSILPKYSYEFRVNNNKLVVYGWLDVDKKQEQYYFVKQEFDIL